MAGSLIPTHGVHHPVPDAVRPGEEGMAETVFEGEFPTRSIGLHNACEARAITPHFCERLRALIDNETKLPSPHHALRLEVPPNDGPIVVLHCF